jgi:hypothetical protein
VISDKTVFYTFKYLPFFLALCFIGIPLLGHLDPENSTFNGKPGPPDFWTTVILVLIGIVVGLLPFLYISRLVVVELNDQTIKIIRGNNVVESNWRDVETVKMLPAIFPPLYRLKLKNHDDYFIFNTRRRGAHFMIFIWDWSDMGALIKKKKQELGI